MGKKSRSHRVVLYGEVFTPPHIVSEMVNLVANEASRIDSRFLEPSCGNGNFLVEILNRKLAVAERYAKSQYDYERYAVIAVSSLYGIELLEDNVNECRQRMFDIFDRSYTKLFRHTKNSCRDSVLYILNRNIVHGNTLLMRTIDNKPIIFSEWSFINSLVKRRDFAFHKLVSDENPTPEREYHIVHFLDIANAYDC